MNVVEADWADGWRMERDIITTMANVTGKKEWWKSRHGELSRHARASELAAAATAMAEPKKCISPSVEFR